ncbi:hypothetical protein B0H19DRAFT_1374591 [Mycena capillaripes]|nr:hypothetical protein B0H19DRAFT_1374591 [Mycena capillaripes]
MPRVPNELVDAIIREIEDRILLRSLRLRADSPNYTAARIFLDEYPHITVYIRALHMWLPTPTTSNSEMESFAQILDRLENVLDAVFGFPARQSLRQLHVCALEDIPIPLFFAHLTAAPKITLLFVSCSAGSDDPPALIPLIHSDLVQYATPIHQYLGTTVPPTIYVPYKKPA